MPRKIALSYPQRVQLFLAFRRIGKIYPTAKRHGVARSTVARVIADFVDGNFSKVPRLSLPRRMLGLAQEAHLGEVARQLNTTPGIAVSPPGQSIPSDRNAAERAMGLVPDEQNLRISKSLRWHLKGSAAEETVLEVDRAIGDHERRLGELWHDIADRLHKICGVEVRPIEQRDLSDRSAQIFDPLVTMVCRWLFHLLDEPGSGGERWPTWTTLEGRDWVLVANGQDVASGARETHDKVRRGVESLVDPIATPMQMARELQLTYHDLLYLVPIVSEALGEMSDDVLKGICPECPYPEALLDPQEDQTDDDGAQ